MDVALIIQVDFPEAGTRAKTRHGLHVLKVRNRSDVLCISQQVLDDGSLLG